MKKMIKPKTPSRDSASNATKNSKVATLKRYTSLASAIEMLESKKITLLDPQSWDDRNDRYFIEEFKKHTGARIVRALCLTDSNETYHHWKVFSNGPDGVKIEFMKQDFISIFDKDSNILQANVDYKLLKEVGEMPFLEKNLLPFLKRKPYEGEKEYRIIYSGNDDESYFPRYDFNPNIISKITLSPWLHDSHVSILKAVLRQISGIKSLKINKSRLIDYSAWKKSIPAIK